MTYGEIYSEIIKIVYGDTTEPDSVDTRLHGSNGLIAKHRKRVMEKENLWFMEKTRDIYVAQGITDYDLHFGNFKEELKNGLRFSSPASGDYQDPLTKIRLPDLNLNFKDYDQETNYPPYYYIEWNPTSSYRMLQLKPKPQEFTDTVELSTATTAEQFANTAFTYVIDGEDYDKAAADNTFSAADTINTGTAAGIFWGVWLIQIDADGTISTKPGGGLSDQVYTSELNAINALPQVDSGNWPVGYITVAANTGASWTANADDLTIGSDVSDVNYYNVTALLHMRYWGYLDDLSDTDATFDATEDQISIQCPYLVIWACVKDLSEVRHDFELLQIANQDITSEYNALIDKNFQFRKANTGKIPYKRI